MDRLRPLLESADVVVEQFRPGVMDRLGLGYEALSADQLPHRLLRDHRLRPTGTEGTDRRTRPQLSGRQPDCCRSRPAATAHRSCRPRSIADIAGGAYPAVINILLALLRARAQRPRLHARRLDDRRSVPVPLLERSARQRRPVAWPRPGARAAVGRQPALSDVSDPGRPLSRGGAARGEVLAELLRSDRTAGRSCATTARIRQATKRAVRRDHRPAHAAEWTDAFDGKDVCCNVVSSLEEAMHDPQFRARGLFSRSVVSAGRRRAARRQRAHRSEPFRDPRTELRYPSLGEANELLGRTREM